MEIQEIKILRGPNFWSIRRPNLIQMKLDLEELEYRPSNTIEGFRERIEQLLPTMIDHQCSEGHRGGFFKRVEDGTWMGHIIEHIALEMQSLAGMNCGFGRTRSTGERDGIYNVVFEYETEEAGIYTAKAAVRIVLALVDGINYNIEADIQALCKIHKESRPTHFIRTIIQDATKRDIPYIQLKEQTLVQLGYGVHQKHIRDNWADTTSTVSIDDLFPKNPNGRIPIIAITGSNGKTIIAHLIAHIAQTAGKYVGCSSSNGVYIQNQPTLIGNGTTQESALLVLKDPRVDFAVLECNLFNILEEGLAFQLCNLAIVTNISTDQVVFDDIHSVEKLARAEQVVPETVSSQGYAILNADDDLVYHMKNELRCKMALFSKDENNPRIRAHCAAGGKAAVLENGFITIVTDKSKTQIMAINDIPDLTADMDKLNTSHLLPAVLATFLCQDINPEDIRRTIKAFISFPAQKLEQLKTS